MSDSKTSARKPAARSQNSGVSPANTAESDFQALDRIVAGYCAGHRGASLAGTSVLDLMVWARSKSGASAQLAADQPRTLTAGTAGD